VGDFQVATGGGFWVAIRAQAGDIILYAVRTDTQAQCGYRIDRIRWAHATHQTFSPQYAIELAPTGPIAVPPKAP